MAAPGRPTPQRESRDSDERPRFKDRRPDEYRHPDVNPYLVRHREFGRPLLPADQAWTFRGRWSEAFGREAPLHVEIGPGNGFFLRDLALAHPEWNLLGVEIRYKRTVLCARKLQRAGIDNALVARYHAGFLDDLLDDGEVSGLYVNHPDPWPKERHEKNRLVSGWFLEEVARILRPGAWMRLKSDFRPNCQRIRDLLDVPCRHLPLRVTGWSDDVIRGEAPWSHDIETNYQSKFRRRGLPVWAVEVVRTSG